MAHSVTRALQAIERYQRQPDQIDFAIIAQCDAVPCLRWQRPGCRRLQS